MAHEARFSFRLPAQRTRRASPRQRQVWQLYALGASYKEIACALRLTHESVHRRVKDLHARLGVTTQHETAVLAVSAGIVTHEEQLTIIERSSCGALERARSLANSTHTEAAAMAAQQTPALGRIVHYILPDGHHIGDHRPAIITRVWSDTCVNLTVFTDSENDGFPPNGLIHRTSVSFHEAVRHEFGSWHWPEFVPPLAAPNAGEPSPVTP